MATRTLLAKSIAGEIALSPNPGKSLKKWRTIMAATQGELATLIHTSPSVVSDYENGRRTPGVTYVRKIVEALLKHDKAHGGEIARVVPSQRSNGAILDLKEFLNPIPAEQLVEAVNGEVLAGKTFLKNNLWGYTILDSIQGILTLTESDFIKIYGLTNERAIVFTEVQMGRSPMIAVKVTKPKPSMVVLHGPKAGQVDKLAVKIAEIERIPLIVSNIKNDDELIANLRKLT